MRCGRLSMSDTCYDLRNQLCKLRKDQLGKWSFKGSPKERDYFLWLRRIKLGPVMGTTRSQISGKH